MSIHVRTVLQPAAPSLIVTRIVAATVQAMRALASLAAAADITLDERDERDLRIMRQRA